MTDQTTTTANKSAAGLLSDAIAHMSSLVRKEVDLARAEVSENVTRAGVALGMLAAALVIQGPFTATGALAQSGQTLNVQGADIRALRVRATDGRWYEFGPLGAGRRAAHGEERPARRTGPQGGDHA